MDYCKKLNLRVFIAEHANKITVAEHIFFMLLILARNLLHYDQITRSGNFLNDKKIKLSKELAYKKTLIFGFGRIGKEVAKRCLSFDMDTYAYDPYINKKYFKLLQSGGSIHYKDSLKDFDLDPSRKDFWELGIKIIKNFIDELEKLS